MESHTDHQQDAANIPLLNVTTSNFCTCTVDRFALTAYRTRGSCSTAHRSKTLALGVPWAAAEISCSYGLWSPWQFKSSKHVALSEIPCGGHVPSDDAWYNRRHRPVNRARFHGDEIQITMWKIYTCCIELHDHRPRKHWGIEVLASSRPTHLTPIMVQFCPLIYSMSVTEAAGLCNSKTFRWIPLTIKPSHSIISLYVGLYLHASRCSDEKETLLTT
jgi:hypothetical protein